MKYKKLDTIGQIYFIQNTVTGNVKIGRAKDVNKRLKGLQCACDCPLSLLFSVHVSDMFSEEKILHERFSDYRINGEWFRYEGDVYEYIQELMLNRIKTAQEWKLEQELIRKEKIYNEKKSKKQTVPISVKLASRLSKEAARKFRQKMRRRKIDEMLHRNFK